MTAKNVLEILPSDRSISLEDICTLLDPEAADQHWYILELEGIAPSGVLGRGMVTLEEEIVGQASGLALDWQGIRQLAREMSDIWNLLVVGCPHEPSISRTASREELYESCDFVVERIESAEWLIFCRSSLVFARVARAIATGRSTS